MPYADVCAIIKDERPDWLLEWVNWHFWLGFDHITIYDNDSKVPISDTLKDYKSVTVVPFPGKRQQKPAYRHYLVNFKHTAEWTAIIDGDEFIVPSQHDSILPILDKFKDMGGIFVFWKMFGSSGYDYLPNPSSQVRTFLLRYSPIHDMGKTILHTRIGTMIPNVHVAYAERPLVNEHRVQIRRRGNIPSADLIAINHYFTRTKADFKLKIARGRADTGQQRNYDEVWAWDKHFNQKPDFRAIQLLIDFERRYGKITDNLPR